MTISPESSAPGYRREEIDAAARRIAVTYGLSGITLRRLSSTLEVAPGLIAELEPSMGALVARTFEEAAAAELIATQRDIDRAASPLDALRMVIDNLLDESHENFNSIWADAFSIGRHNARLARAAREGMAHWNDSFIRLIDDGIAAGQFAATDSDLVARVFLGLIDSSTSYALVGYRTVAEWAETVRRTLELSLGLAVGTL